MFRKCSNLYSLVRIYLVTLDMLKLVGWGCAYVSILVMGSSTVLKWILWSSSLSAHWFGLQSSFSGLKLNSFPSEGNETRSSTSKTKCFPAPHGDVRALTLDCPLDSSEPQTWAQASPVNCMQCRCLALTTKVALVSWSVPVALSYLQMLIQPSSWLATSNAPLRAVEVRKWRQIIFLSWDSYPRKR